MTAVDANALIRLLTAEEPKRGGVCEVPVCSEPIWIAKTVLLETGWIYTTGPARWHKGRVRRNGQRV